jgi:hypothetical protein
MLFCDEFLWVSISPSIYLGCLHTVIILISASWEARNTGISHQHPVYSDYLKTWIITNLPCGYTVQHSRPPAFRTEVRMGIIKKLRGQASVTHQCNPSFLKG